MPFVLYHHAHRAADQEMAVQAAQVEQGGGALVLLYQDASHRVFHLFADDADEVAGAALFAKGLFGRLRHR